MRYFRRISAPWTLEILEDLKRELALNEQAWLQNLRRQQTIRVQKHTQAIFLRGAKRSPGDETNPNDIHPSCETALASLFPVAMGCIKRIAEELEGEPCRALYARLRPHSEVYPHIDVGSYYSIRDRYHLVVESVSGSILKCGDEEVTMHDGELWWFDNKSMHESLNPSDDWRTHLIVDLLPSPRKARVLTASWFKQFFAGRKGKG